jgi:vacuolar-type H+-ATPase catalytic subunit A/Vma1
LENIFDGIQRPLKTIAEKCKSMFIPKGVDIESLDLDKLWEFTPEKTLKVGDLVGGGDVIGSVYENGLFEKHKIMIPPRITGKI